MTPADSTPADPFAAVPAWADGGLLSPGHVGTPVEEATGDTALLQAMLDAEAALTRAQATLGQAPAAAAAAVTAAARAERFDARGIALRARAHGNPVIALVADLTAAVRADVAPCVHRGATSQDIVDTALMLVASRSVRLIVPDLHRTAAALAHLAAVHRDTPMPGRTLTQHAVPTTFGLKAAGWRSLVLDAADRLQAVRLPAQLGGAAGTLAAFGVQAGSGAGEEEQAGAPSAEPAGPADAGLGLVAAYADELGLPAAELPWHTLRTPVADLAAALAFTAAALGKLAADVLLLSRTEIAEVAEGTGGASSAMPHKANPVAATLVAAAARQAPALAATLIGSLAAEDERPAGAWHAEWQPLRELLRLTGGACRAAAGMTEQLRVFPERMLENLRRTRGLIVSERLTAELAEILGRQEARQLLDRAAHRAAAEEPGLAEALAAEPALEGRIDPDRLRALTDPAAYLGSAPALVDRALTRSPQPLPSPADRQSRNHP